MADQIGSAIKGQDLESAEPEFAEDSAALAPSALYSIEGIDFDENASNNGSSFSIPPDSMGAVGPSHLVSVVNRSIQWHTKAGVQENSQGLASFFAALSPATLTFDPKVIYDQYAGRFVVVTLEKIEILGGTDPSNISRILLAVSDDSDPNGAWRFHEINAKTTIIGADYWADYPGLAVDEKAVYITANLFAHISRGFGGSRLWIVDKGMAGGLYAGQPGNHIQYDPAALTGGLNGTMQPAHIFGTPQPNVGTFLVMSGLTDGTDEYLQVIRVDNPVGIPLFTSQFVNVGDIDNHTTGLPDAPQQGTSQTIEVNDRRALNAVWRNNQLYVSSTILPNSGPDLGQTTAHWWRVDTSNLAALTAADQGNVGGEDIAAGTYTFFPSIAVDGQGNMAIGFSASAPSIFPGAYYSGRVASDPPGTVQPAAVFRAGKDYYVRTFGGSKNRWGDYSGASVDPGDDSTFCLFNEYALDRGTAFGGEDGRWGTAFGCFSFAAVPGAPTGVTATAGVGSATISWIPPGDDGGSPITNYKVTSNPASPSSPMTVANVLTTAMTGLSSGTAYTFTVSAITATGEGPASGPSNAVTPEQLQGDEIWVEDALPTGATPKGVWNWVNTAPAPFSGTLAHQSTIATGLDQHFFIGATDTLQVGPGDTLVAYVYLDPANPPTEIMLQWNSGNWNHRAYWGANNIDWGVNGTASRRFMGPLPPTGQWVRLEVPASVVGLEGSTVTGMAFTLYDGRATWDHAGLAGTQPVLTTIGVSPDPAFLEFGEGQQFTAQPLDQFGNPINVPIIWSATGGTINTTGFFTAGGTVGAFSVTASSGSVSGSATVTIGGVGDIIWVEDALPAGATPKGVWNWVDTAPVSFSGTLAHQSTLTTGLHQHFFVGATNTLQVVPGDTLIAYVYLDPANPPTEVMLQWNNGSWVHRAYWGANNIDWGVNGTASRRFMGPLPPTGQWVRLEVPASLVGLEGSTVTGMAFTLYDGRATWDHAGLAGNQPVLTSIGVSPDPAFLEFGEGQQFTAQPLDQFGNSINVPIIWSATGGTINTTGFFTAGGTVGAFSVTAASGSVSGSATVTIGGVGDIIWVEDALPTGATPKGVWNWVNTAPVPFSGTLAHQSTLTTGLHQHFFIGTTGTLQVVPGDTLVAYVYLDPANPPTEVMLQWNNGNWDHRAYWGANSIDWGVNGTASRRFMGSLPPTGQWVRLEAPASVVGLEGSTVTGMAFTLYDGRATWDHAGLAAPEANEVGSKTLILQIQ